MNYYPFHIGDYVSATRHLSWEEDAAFRRLLDTYYTTEKPIPGDLRAACRLVMAQTDSQREAVRVVLEEFFALTDSGWVNKRADVEIQAMREKQQKQRDKANKRWHKPEPVPGNATASKTDATASKTHADAMPPTPTPTPTPTPLEVNTPLPFPTVRDSLCEFADGAPTGDAKVFHAWIAQRMRDAGWDIDVEVEVGDRGDGRGGRIDILVKSPCVVGVELDRVSPRVKSLEKLSHVDGYRVVMLRESDQDSSAPGIDAVIGCKRGSAGADGFDEFWLAYPRKTAKPAALKAFCKLAPSAELLDDLLQAIARQKHWPAWCKDDGQFIPHPATWINGRRWEDQAQAPPAVPFESAKTRAARERVFAMTGGILGRPPTQQTEVFDAATNRLTALG